MIEQIPESVNLHTSKSHEPCIDEKDVPLYDEEFLNKLNLSGLPPQQLPIKKFCYHFDMKFRHFAWSCQWYKIYY